MHLMSPGTVDLVGDLPHPLRSKQPLSCTQGTAGVLGTVGVSVWPHITEIPQGMKQSPFSHCKDCWGALFPFFSPYFSPDTAAGLPAG